MVRLWEMGLVERIEVTEEVLERDTAGILLPLPQLLLLPDFPELINNPYHDVLCGHRSAAIETCDHRLNLMDL